MNTQSAPETPRDGVAARAAALNLFQAALSHRGGLDEGVGGAGLSTPNLASMPLGASARTVTVWLKSNGSTTPGQVDLVGQFDYNTLGGFALTATRNDYGLTGFFGWLQDLTVVGGIMDAKWHFLAAAYDGSSLRMYLDGAQVGGIVPDLVNQIGAKIGCTFLWSAVPRQRLGCSNLAHALAAQPGVEAAPTRQNEGNAAATATSAMHLGNPAANMVVLNLNEFDLGLRGVACKLCQIQGVKLDGALGQTLLKAHMLQVALNQRALHTGHCVGCRLHCLPQA